jgi:hypothetical protein
MSETELQLQITFGSIFEKLKIFKSLLTEDQLNLYNEKINLSKTELLKNHLEVSKESLALLEKHYS